MAGVKKKLRGTFADMSPLCSWVRAEQPASCVAWWVGVQLLKNCRDVLRSTGGRCFVLCWDVWRVKASDPCVLMAVACPHGFGASFLPGVDFLPDGGLFRLSACFLAGWLWFPLLLSSEISCVSCANPLSDSGLQTPSSRR